MVSIFTGGGAGFERGSGSVLGIAGLLGSGATGRSGDQVSVNAANGNLLIARTDEFLSGRGPDAGVSRTYNSLGDFSDDNGDNWRQSTDRRIKDFSGSVNTAGSSVSRVSGDGSVIRYGWNGSAYVATDGGGAYDQLTFADNVWTWRDGDMRITERYTAYSGGWRIAEQRDFSGNTLKFDYDDQNRLSKVSTANGEFIKYEWSGNAISAVVTGTSDDGAKGSYVQSRTSYSYDELSRLQTVTVDLTPEQSGTVDGKTYTTTYGYDGTSKRVARIAQSDGSLVEIFYAGDKVASYRETVADGITRTTTLTYGQNATSISDPLGQVTTLAYNADGSLASITSPAPGDGSPGQIASFRYDGNGNVDRITDGLGAATAFTFTASGQIDTQTDRLGNVVRRTYDGSNNLLTETRTAASETSAAEQLTTRYAYDAASRLRFEIAEQGSVREHRYDQYGQRILTIDYVDQRYAVSGLAATTAPSVNDLANWAAEVSDARNARVEETRYDARGNIREVVEYSLSPTLRGPTAGSVETVPIVDNANTTVTKLSDGMFRITKTGGVDGQFDADARSTLGLTGDFVLQVRPTDANAIVLVGVSSSPTDSSSYTNLLDGYYFELNGQLNFAGGGATLDGGSNQYRAGENLWIVRSASTLSFYKGETLERARTTTPIRTVTRGEKTLYFDCSLFQTQTSVDVALTQPASAGVVGKTTTYVYDPFGQLLSRHVSSIGDAPVNLPATEREIVISDENFEGGAPGWRLTNAPTATVDNPAAGADGRLGRILGRFGGTGGQEGLFKTFALDGSKPNASVQFDMLKIDSWDGETFQVFIEGGQAISFQPQFYGGGLRTASGNFTVGGITGSYTIVSATAQDTHYGYNRDFADARYRVRIDLTGTGSSVRLGFGSTLDQDLNDEALGIDNIAVTQALVSNTIVANDTFDGSSSGWLNSADNSPAITDGPTSGAGGSLSQFLGRFGASGGGEVAYKNYALDPTKDVTQVDFDFLKIDSWDGEAFQVFINGQTAFSFTPRSTRDNETLSGVSCANGPFTVGGLQGHYYVAAVASTDGDYGFNQGTYWRDGIYRVRLELTGNASSLRLGVGSTLNQDANDEAFGIDNVRVMQSRNLPQTVLVADTFDNGSPSGWTQISGGAAAGVDIQSNGNSFLGRFAGSGGTQAIGKTVTLDASKDLATIDFDFFKIDSWDGGELFQLFLDGQNALSFKPMNYGGDGLDTAIGDISIGGITGTYTITPSQPQVDLGLGYSYWADGNYHVQLKLKGFGSALRVGVGSTLDQPASDESYGIDNFIVKQPSGRAVALEDFENGSTAGWQTPVSLPPVEAPSGGVSNALGRFAGSGGTEVVSKDYAFERIGGNAVIAFTFIKADTWDGGENFSVFLNGLSAISFTPLTGYGGSESANGRFDVGGVSGRYTIAAISPETQIAYTPGTDRFYQVRIEVEQVGNALTLGFGSNTNEELSNESFAIDNLRVTQVVPAPTTLPTELFVYDGLGRVVSSTDVNGGTSTFLFDDAANKTVVTLASGLVRTSTYDRTGELIAVAESGAFTNVGTESYVYDAAGRLRVSTDATGRASYFLYDRAGRKVADVDHDGAMVEYVYDRNDRVASTIRYAVRLTEAQMVIVRDPATGIVLADLRPSAANSLRSWQVYDAEGRVIEIIDSQGEVVTSDYDASGQLIRTTAYGARLTADQMNGLGGIVSALILPTGFGQPDRVSRIFYDKRGLVIGALDATGGFVRTEYDGAGRKVAETASARAISNPDATTLTFYAVADMVGSSPNDRTMRWVYDAQGLMRYQFDATGAVTEFVYDRGQLGTSTGAVRQTVQYSIAAAPSSYDYAAVKALVDGLAGDPNKRSSYTIYDRAGRAGYTIDAAGAVTGFAYDGSGRVVRSVQYAELYNATFVPSHDLMNVWASAVAGNPDDRVTRNFYNARDELVLMVDGEGYVTQRGYDAEGRLVATARFDTPIAIDDTATTASVFAALVGIGKVVTATTYDNEGRVSEYSDEGSIVRKSIYNALGQLESDIVAYGTADAVTTAYTYDAAGRMASSTAAAGTPYALTTRYDYNSFGEISVTTGPDGGTTTTGFDRAGRVTASIDALGQVTRFAYNVFGEVISTLDARSADTRTFYDKAGRVIAVRDGENYVTETSYTLFGDIASTTRRYNASTVPIAGYPDVIPSDKDAVTRFEYDRLGRVTATIDAENHREAYALNAFGQRVQVTNRIGAVTVNAFDRRGMLIRETLPITAWGTAVVNAFQYDARGNRTAMIEAAGVRDQRVTNYAYDPLDRLVETRRKVALSVTQTVEAVERMAYDKRGNVIERFDAGNGRSLIYYDALDRVVATVDAVGALVTSSYVVSPTGGSRRIDVAYAAALANSASLPAGGSPPAPAASIPSEDRSTETTFDKLGRTIFVRQLGVLVGAWNGTNYVLQDNLNPQTSYQYDANGNVILTQLPDGGNTYTYYDKLGRATAKVDSIGYKTTWTRDAEGNVLTERRYANATTGATASNLAAAVESADDRITNFAYDRNGRRTEERRTNVQAYTVDGNGALAAASATPIESVVRYTYNGLGLVSTRSEATSDTVTYDYDGLGRLVTETRPAFGGEGGVVTPITDYVYDGLGNLARTTLRGAAGAADRVTTYEYGAGGRVVAMMDATSATASTARRAYFYDAAGRKTAEQYNRALADGSERSEAIKYDYDLAGRLIRQSFARYEGNAFISVGEYTALNYNAFNELTRRAIGDASGEVEQERNRYDNAGRLWASNAGDGVQRFYISDGRGNRVMMIESAGNDIRDNADGDAKTELTAIYGRAAAAAGEGIVTTTMNYDTRGQQLATVQRDRELTISGSKTNLTSATRYNAFGEVAAEQDAGQFAAGVETTYAYNTMGRVIAVTRPQVTVVSAQGVASQSNPIDRSYYDIAGRLVATQDANGNTTTRTLLAGTGYGEAEALVTGEYRPTGEITRMTYDVFGDQRTSSIVMGRDGNQEILRTTTMSYDALGRLTASQNARGLVDYYGYDALGQRITHWNSMLGGAYVERTGYDIEGRVISQGSLYSQLPGDAYQELTTYSYQWDAGAATQLGVYGAYITTTTYANNRTSVEVKDEFDHVLRATEMSGNSFFNFYDHGGRIFARVGTDFTNYTYLNTGLVGIAERVGLITNVATTYSYDEAGRKKREVSVFKDVETQVSSDIQNATATYDVLGRMTSWDEAGSANIPAAHMVWQYDAVGNIRSATSTSRFVNSSGPVGDPFTTTAWYAYDQMNRTVIDQGVLQDGQVQRGIGDSRYITYNRAGERETVNSLYTFTKRVLNPAWDPEPLPGGGPRPPRTIPADVAGEQQERYTYNADGTLASVLLAQTSDAVDNGDGTASPLGLGPASERATYTTDLMGRVIRQLERDADGTVAYDRNVQFDGKGREWIITTSGYQRTGTDGAPVDYTSQEINEYGVAGSNDYALGQVLGTSLSSTVNGVAQKTSSTNYEYAWFDGPQQQRIIYRPDAYGAPDATNTTTYTYDSTGALIAADVQDGRPRTVKVVNDVLGQAILRKEASATPTTDPVDVWYRFDGRQVGYVGNSGTSNAGYASSIDRRTSATGSPRDGNDNVDFNQSYQAINSYYQGSDSGNYTVRAGDTLAGIAATLWGDANLWYKIAQANGIAAADSMLVTGTSLRLPAGVVRTSNNASTFRPYDPTDAFGETSPTTPKPQAIARSNKKKCGVFGQILTLVVSVATSYLFGSVPGNIITQAFGNIIGTQKGFSWKSLAISTASTVITAGLDQAGLFGKAAEAGAQVTKGALGVTIGNAAVRAGLNGVLASTITQGVAVATKLQSRFDFAGVAAAGVGAGVSSAISGRIGLPNGSFGDRLAANTAGGIANAATRSVVNGTGFGDNVMAALPDIIGNTVGGYLADQVSSRTSYRSTLTPADPIEPYGDMFAVTSLPFDSAGLPDLTGYGGGGANGRANGATAVIEQPVSAAELLAATKQAIGNIKPVPNASTFQANAVGGPSPGVNRTFSKAASIEDSLILAEGGVGYYKPQPDGSLVFVRLKVVDDRLAAFDRQVAIGLGAPVLAGGTLAGVGALAAPALPGLLNTGRNLIYANALRVSTGVDILADFTTGVSVSTYAAAGAGAVATAARIESGAGRAIAAESATARAARLGREGEAAAGIGGPKVGVEINGKMRFPDELSPNLLKEVKNVARQGWTRQLRDYSDLARERGIPFELWVRQNTRLSGPLRAAEIRGDVIIRRELPRQ